MVVMIRHWRYRLPFLVELVAMKVIGIFELNWIMSQRVETPMGERCRRMRKVRLGG